MRFILIAIVQIACMVHVIKTGANRLWFFALLFAPGLSAIAYLLVEVLPQHKHNRHVRGATKTVVNKIDPDREVRDAKARLELTDSSANRQALADALAAQGNHAQAVDWYRKAFGARVPPTREGLRYANSLVQIDKERDALALLDAMEEPSTQSDQDRMKLMRAQVYAELDRKDEAAALYAEIVDRMPGDEARCRYAGLLIDMGREDAAKAQLETVKDRLQYMDRWQRAEHKQMYDWAMQTLKSL